MNKTVTLTPDEVTLVRDVVTPYRDGMDNTVRGFMGNYPDSTEGQLSREKDIAEIRTAESVLKKLGEEK